MDDLPNDLCMIMVEKVGSVQFDALPKDLAEKMRQNFADKAMDCMVSSLI